MDVEHLFRHALSTLPEAVGDLMRERRDPGDFVFTSFDGRSALGTALIASDLVTELGIEVDAARVQARRMVTVALDHGDELVVSLMVTKDVVERILAASSLDVATRLAMRLWLEAPVPYGQYRVIAIVDGAVRAESVGGDLDGEDAEPVPSSSMLN